MLGLTVENIRRSLSWTRGREEDILSERNRELQKKESKAIVEVMSPDLRKIKERLSDINYVEMEDLLATKFYEYDVERLFQIILIALFQREGMSTKVQLEGIHYWLERLSVLAKGSNGEAFTGDIRDMIERGTVVVKYSETSVAHEAFVGMLGTNFLRYWIPNFSYVYLGFDCSSPIVFGKEVLDWCTRTGGNIDYVLYENVKPAKSLHDLAPEADGKDFLDWYLQIVLALQFAFEKIRFTHYDLHPKNILMRDVGREVVIPYRLENESYYIRTSLIATLIDYGFSSIVYEGEVFNVPSLFSEIPLGNPPYFPLYDAYRLLTTSYLRVENNKKTKRLLEKIFRYFSEEPLEKMVEFGESGSSPGGSNYSALPADLYKLDLTGLIGYLISLGPTNLVGPPEGRGNVISCSDRLCPSLHDLETDVNLLVPRPRPYTLFQLYYLLNLEPDPVKREEIALSFPPDNILRAREEYLRDIRVLQITMLPRLHPRSIKTISRALKEYADYFTVFKRARQTLEIFDYLTVEGYLSLDLRRLTFLLTRVIPKADGYIGRLERASDYSKQARNVLDYASSSD